jgi:hypothetical protein
VWCFRCCGDQGKPATSGIDAVIREFVAAGVTEHIACALMPSSGATAARSTMREKLGAVSGAPRSDTNTNGDCSADGYSGSLNMVARSCRREIDNKTFEQIEKILV